MVGCYRDVELSRQHPFSETLSQLSRETVFHRELLRGQGQEDTRLFIEATAGLKPPPGLVETTNTLKATRAAIGIRQVGSQGKR